MCRFYQAFLLEGRVFVHGSLFRSSAMPQYRNTVNNDLLFVRQAIRPPNDLCQSQAAQHFAPRSSPDTPIAAGRELANQMTIAA